MPMYNIVVIAPGTRFGKWVTTGASRKGRGGRRMWEVRCDCGYVTFNQSGNLRNGVTTMCRVCYCGGKHIL